MHSIDARLMATFAVMFAAMAGIAGALGRVPEALVAGCLGGYCAWRAVRVGWPGSRGGIR